MERKTNVDVEGLAGSESVRSYMQRILPEVTDPLTGYVFAVALAKRAADAFDLYEDDGVIFPATLVNVAEGVILVLCGVDRVVCRRAVRMRC